MCSEKNKQKNSFVKQSLTFFNDCRDSKFNKWPDTTRYFDDRIYCTFVKYGRGSQDCKTVGKTSRCLSSHCCFAKIKHDEDDELTKRSLNEETTDFSALQLLNVFQYSTTTNSLSVKMSNGTIKKVNLDFWLVVDTI